MRGATNQLHTRRPGTARAMPVPWAMSKAAFWSLWCFVFVLPWDKFIVIPVLGSIPRLVGLVASAVGVVHVLAQRRGRPLSLYYRFSPAFFVLVRGGALLAVDTGATGVPVLCLPSL